LPLERKAHQGDSHAARELRSWLQEYPPTDDTLDLADLEPQMIDRMYLRLLAEIEAEDAASEAEA
jgi:hypothetical protein